MDELADFFVEPADWRHDREAICPIRIAVFVDEQQVPEDEELDDDDPVSRHFLARDLAGAVVGTARLTPDGRIGRMAVDREWRGRGVGAALLTAAVNAAREAGMPELRLSAQTHAIPFYERHGFVAEGPEHDDAGIPHRWMRRTVEAFDLGPVARQRRADQLRPALEDGRFEGPTAYADAVVRLIEGTRYRLALFSHDLEPQVLNRAEVIEALTRFLAEAREPELRIVVLDTARAVELGHRLIALGQRWTTAIGFRNPPRELADEPGTYLVADERHVLHREFADRYSGYVRLDAPDRARQLLDAFDAAWEHGTVDARTRRLDL